MKRRVTAAVERARRRSGWLDHGFTTLEHYNSVNGSALAAAATYFGYLSFFPILALAFFVVGKVAIVFPNAEENLTIALTNLLPGIVGDGPNQVSLEVFTDNATKVGLIGLVGVIYAGTGWLSGVRNGLAAVFEIPRTERPSFVLGKARDALALAVLGTVLLATVAVSGFLTGGSAGLLTRSIAIAATTLLLMLMYRLPGPNQLTRRARSEGALLGAVAFELLKTVAWALLDSIRSQPAFAVFGISLVLLVWINYFSKILLISAAWAQSTRRS